MKKAILLAAVLCLGASQAFAGALYMRYNQCFGDANASATANFVCDDFASTDLYITYMLDASTPNVVALSGGIDLLVEGQPTLPAFWQMAANGCNGTGININDARGTLCTNAGGVPIFSGSGGATTDAFILAYLNGYNGPANGARILWAVVRASSNPATLAGNPTKQFACIIQFFDDNAIPAGGSCDGCGLPVAMAANWILLEAPAQAGGDVTAAVITSGDPGSDVVCLSDGATGEISVPTRNRTWGQVKNLYR